MYLVYILSEAQINVPRLHSKNARASGRVFSRTAACASLLSGIHNVQQRKCLSLQNLGREINRHFAEPPEWDRRPLLGGDGGLYDHDPIKSNSFST
jgi:hypothetical protein